MERAVVKTVGLNVHEQPTSHSKVKDKLAQGDQFDVVDYHTTQGYVWVYIRHRRGSGWVYGQDIRVLTNPPIRPPAPPDIPPPGPRGAPQDLPPWIDESSWGRPGLQINPPRPKTPYWILAGCVVFCLVFALAKCTFGG